MTKFALSLVIAFALGFLFPQFVEAQTSPYTSYQEFHIPLGGGIVPIEVPEGSRFDAAGVVSKVYPDGITKRTTAVTYWFTSSPTTETHYYIADVCEWLPDLSGYRTRYVERFFWPSKYSTLYHDGTDTYITDVRICIVRLLPS
jgi:hypothetical protein